MLRIYEGAAFVNTFDDFFHDGWKKPLKRVRMYSKRQSWNYCRGIYFLKRCDKTNVSDMWAGWKVLGLVIDSKRVNKCVKWLLAIRSQRIFNTDVYTLLSSQQHYHIQHSIVTIMRGPCSVCVRVCVWHSETQTHSLFLAGNVSKTGSSLHMWAMSLHPTVKGKDWSKTSTRGGRSAGGCWMWQDVCVYQRDKVNLS